MSDEKPPVSGEPRDGGSQPDLGDATRIDPGPKERGVLPVTPVPMESETTRPSRIVCQVAWAAAASSFSPVRRATTAIPPMPSPVANRYAESTCTFEAVLDRYMPTAIRNRQAKTAGRRPAASATDPKMTDPKDIPMSSIDSTTPSAARLMPHSSAMPGDAKLMARTSKPSRAVRQTQIAMAATWRSVIDEEARMSLGSACILLRLVLVDGIFDEQRTHITSCEYRCTTILLT